jgi:hypothetical protein
MHIRFNEIHCLRIWNCHVHQHVTVSASQFVALTPNVTIIVIGVCVILYIFCNQRSFIVYTLLCFCSCISQFHVQACLCNRLSVLIVPFRFFDTMGSGYYENHWERQSLWRTDWHYGINWNVWSRHRSADYLIDYYWNRETGESTWDRPAAVLYSVVVRVDAPYAQWRGFHNI